MREDLLERGVKLQWSISVTTGKGQRGAVAPPQPALDSIMRFAQIR